MDQLHQSLDAFQSRWIRLGVVPLLDKAEVKSFTNGGKLHEPDVPKPAFRSVAEQTNAVLESTMPAVNRLAKVADDDADLAKALKDYQDMVQRRRENLAMEEYHRLVERIGELTEEDEFEEDESECIVAESSTASSDDPYDADDEKSLCNDPPAPSTRATIPSFGWSEDEENSSVSTNTCATSLCGSPHTSMPTYSPWTGAKLLDRLVALPTAGEWKYSKFEQEEYCAGAEGAVERLTMDTIFENGLAGRGLVGRRA